jgi:hypothetical protein
MNIFVVDECPVVSASSLLDKHVVKMPLESLQMMSTNAWYNSLRHPYHPVMTRHPCTIWARESRQNFEWLWEHAIALCVEYTARYGRVHKCEKQLTVFNPIWEELLMLLPDIGLTPFAIAISEDMNCRKVEGFDSLSTVDKYRQYYIHDKARIATWKQNKPSWYVEEKMEIEI